MQSFRTPAGRNVLLCFSPTVMVTTFIVEILLAAYVAWRYRLDLVGKLITAILVCLATFQAAEYIVCTAPVPELPFSRLGFVAITLLPPLGLHLASALARKKTVLVPIAYAAGAAFAGFFALAPGSVNLAVCTGNYVIFDIREPFGWPYTYYYYILLLIGLAFSLMQSSRTRVHRGALRALAVGYLVFMVPTAVVNSINPQTIAGIPSIMCGFAVVLALILAFRVAPEALAPRVAPTPVRKGRSGRPRTSS